MEGLELYGIDDDPQEFTDAYRAGYASVLGVDPAVTIPTVDANYTDAKTVTAVQAALVKKGYSCGDTGPNRDGVDGVFGPKTKAAIKKMQGDAGLEQSGKIDYGVIMALKVTPGVLPPGVTLAGRAAVQAQVALDAATKAEHATTSGDLQAAAQAALDAANAAAPPPPPAVKQAAEAALVKARAATTPALVQAAQAQVQSAAKAVASEVKPSWWTSPAWAGGLERWKVVLIGSGAAVGLGSLLVALLISPTTAATLARGSAK